MSESVFENSSRFVAADVRRLKFPWKTALLMRRVSLLTSAAAIFQTRPQVRSSAASALNREFPGAVLAIVSYFAPIQNKFFSVRMKRR